MIRISFFIVLGLFVFMFLVLWLSKKLWPDMYDDYETLEWDEDITAQLGERKGDERGPD